MRGSDHGSCRRFGSMNSCHGRARTTARRPAEPTRAVRLGALAVAVGAALLVACGSSDEDGTDTPVTPDGSVAPDDVPPPEAGADDASTGGAASSADGALGPISWQELIDPTGENAAAGAAAAADAESAEQARLDGLAAGCGLLSTESMLAAIASNVSAVPELTAASPVGCTWATTPFSFDVTVEPAADVDVVNHDGRAYNIGIEPVVTPQGGPGENAVTLTDTAFADDTNDGFTYAFFFVLDDAAVTLRSTSLQMNDERWQSLAQEVADNLAAGNAGLDVAAAGGGSETGGEAATGVTWEPCDYFSVELVADLVGVGADQLTTIPTASVSVPSCLWDTPDQSSYLKVEAGFTSLDPDGYRAQYPDATELPNDGGFLVLRGPLDAAVYIPRSVDGTEWFDWVRITGSGDAPAAAATLIADNLVP